jgi:hypothetical protein
MRKKMTGIRGAVEDRFVLRRILRLSTPSRPMT